MSLIGKGPTMPLAIMLAVALACSAALLAGDVPAFADEPCDSDPSTPECLAITSVSSSPELRMSPRHCAESISLPEYSAYLCRFR